MSLRPATPDDATGLRDLEEVANLRALGRVFPPEETGRERDAEWSPYPVECELVLEG